MRDFSNYRPSTNRLLWSANKLFENQLQAEGSDIEIDNVICRGVVRNHGNPTNEFKEERYLITSKSLSVNRGSLVKYLGDNYIVTTSIDKDNLVYDTCKMERCNHTLKYQDKNGILYEVPAIVVDVASYSDGVSESKILNVPDSLLKIIVSKNASTDVLELDKRLIIDKKAWKISSISGIQDGIYTIICKSDQKNSVVDDLTNEIANKNQDIEEILYVFEYPSEVTTQINNVVNYSFVVKKNGVIVNNPTLDISVDNSSIILQNGNPVAKVEGYSYVTISFTGDDGQEYINMITVNIVVEITESAISYQILSEDGKFEVKKYCTTRYSIQKFRDGYPVNATYSIGVLYENIGLIEYEVVDGNSVDITNMYGGNEEMVTLLFSDISTGSSTTQGILLSL